MSEPNVEELKENIRKALSASEQELILDFGNKHDDLIKACKGFLYSFGYKIVDPLESKHDIKKLDDLISLFDQMLKIKHPEWAGRYSKKEKDRRLARYFVEKRMKASNINKKEAMKECADIIETVFEHEEEFGFDERPLSFDFFGQDDFGWVTDVAVKIINRKKAEKEERERKALIESYQKRYEREETNFERDLDEILGKLQQKEEKP
jgi:hypothetical protein